MRARIAHLAGAVQFVLLTLATAADPPSYLGDWSNGRGETLAITSGSIQFGNDRPVPYREVSRGADGAMVELQITAPKNGNAFAGKTLALLLEGDSMQMIGYLSHGDCLEKKNPQQIVNWERDSPRDAKQESEN